MIDISKGRYWDLPWSLVDGCTPCSPGCDHCWSAAMAHRFDIEGEPGHENHIVTENKSPRFNGVIVTHPERLSIPLKRRKPTVYAVWNDLFHEAVPDEFIIQAFNAMSPDILQLNPQKHTYLVLTKRPRRMATFFKKYTKHGTAPWHFVYLGLTVCNQQEADEKIPIFLQVPGKKFLSIEPMLGPIHFSGTDCIIPSGPYRVNWHPLSGNGLENIEGGPLHINGPKIDAVILGGETGPGARPMHPDWVRSVRDQCAAAGVPFFFKQWGEWGPTGKKLLPTKFNPAEMGKIGRNKAGRLLDGRTHDDLPWVK